MAGVYNPNPPVCRIDVGSGTIELAKLSADKACVVIGVLGGYAMGQEAHGNEVVMVVIAVVVIVLILMSSWQ